MERQERKMYQQQKNGKKTERNVWRDKREK